MTTDFSATELLSSIILGVLFAAVLGSLIEALANFSTGASKDANPYDTDDDF